APIAPRLPAAGYPWSFHAWPPSAGRAPGAEAAAAAQRRPSASLPSARVQRGWVASMATTTRRPVTTAIVTGCPSFSFDWRELVLGGRGNVTGSVVGPSGALSARRASPTRTP